MIATTDEGRPTVAEKTAPLVLTYKEAAALAGIDVRRISAAVESGDIPSVQLGVRKMIPRAPFLKMFGVDA